jgi:hypothetical protein
MQHPLKNTLPFSEEGWIAAGRVGGAPDLSKPREIGSNGH